MFGVNGAESFQSEYQKLVDTWLRRFTEIEMKRENEAQKEAEKGVKKETPQAPTLTKTQASQTQEEIKAEKDIKVFDSEGNLLYGETESGKVCQITPEHIQKLEEASDLYIGNILEGLPSLQIEVDGETFFQSEYEEVLVNNKVNLADKLREWQKDRKPSGNEFTPDEYEAYSELIQDPAAALLDDELTRKIVKEMVRHREGEIKIYQTKDGESELVYGRVERNFVNKLTSDQIHHLESAVMLSPGANFSDLSELKIQVGESVIFQVDESGTILVNQQERLPQVIAKVQQPVQSVMPTIQSESDYSGYDDGYFDESYSDGYDNYDDDYSNQAYPDGDENLDDGYDNQAYPDGDENYDYSNEPYPDGYDNLDNSYSNQPYPDGYDNLDNSYSNQPYPDGYDNLDNSYSNQPYYDNFPNQKDNYTPDSEPQPKPEETEIDNAITDLLIELIVPIIEAMPSVHQETAVLQSENNFVDLLSSSSPQQQAGKNVIFSSYNTELTDTKLTDTELTDTKLTDTELTSADTKLTHADTKLTYANNKPTHANNKPTHADTELTHANNKPTHANARLTNANTKPTHANTDLTNANTKPTHANTDLTQNHQVQSNNLSSKLPSEQKIIAQFTEQKNGLDILQSALKSLPETSLKSVLQGMVTDMEKIAAQQESNPAMDILIKERLQQPQNPHWWQQLSAKVETIVTAVRDNFIQYRAASTLKKFANQVALQPGDNYEGAEYNLSRQGKDYTLTDKQGNELMKFQSSVLGVKVDKSLPTLDNSHFQKTEQLRQDFQENKQHTGAFIPEGVAEAKNLARINRITQTLIQYAAKQGGSAKIEGKFSYDWQANAAGNVLIQDKQGKVLLAVSGGHIRSCFCEKDFQHFEQMLPALHNSAGVSRQQSQVKLPIASKGKQIER